MTKRFFVTVIADSEGAFMEMDKFEFSLFHQTAPIARKKQYTVEGLLTLEQVGQLVESGYQVLVKEESSKRARAPREVVEFSEWIKGMEG